MQAMSWHQNPKLRYGLKRFVMYLLFALPAANIPFVFLGVVMGFPAVITTALFISISDGIQSNPNQTTAVFTQKMWLVFAVEIVIVICYFIGFALLRKIGFSS